LPLVPLASVDKADAAAGNAALSRSELDAKAKAYMAENPGISYVAAVKFVQKGA
jgi:hypothetical protein